MKVLLTILLTATLLGLIATVIYYRYRLVKEKYINLKLNEQWFQFVLDCHKQESFDTLVGLKLDVTKSCIEILERNWLLKIFVLRRENKRS